MDRYDLPRGVVAGLFLAGVVTTEALLYQVYHTDSSYPMNINYVFGVLLMEGAALVLVLLLIRHEVGAGVTALLLGSVQAVIFLRSQDPGYYAPPVLEAAAGLIAIIVFGQVRGAVGRPATAPIGPQ